VGEAFELRPKHPIRRRTPGKLVLPGGGQAKGEAAPVIGIRLPLDEPGANERIDGAAHRRRPATNGRGNFVQCRRLTLADGAEQLAPGRLCALGGSVRHPPLGDVGEPRRESRRAVGEAELLHGNYFNSNKVVSVKSLMRLRFPARAAMPAG
jgi:hypothetical protein